MRKQVKKVNGKRQIKVTILYGLPGSGKTFYASKHPTATVIDFDEIIQSFKPNKFAIMAALSKAFGTKLTHKINTIIVDGLVTTNQQLRNVIDSLTASFTDYQLVFELVYWEEDRKSCIHNDKNRREVSSEISIKNLPYETPELKMFPELSQGRIQAMKVVRKSPELVWFIDLCRKLDYNEWAIKQITDSMQMQSASWCLGGTWGSYTGDSGTVDAETPLSLWSSIRSWN